MKKCSYSKVLLLCFNPIIYHIFRLSWIFYTAICTNEACGIFDYLDCHSKSDWFVATLSASCYVLAMIDSTLCFYMIYTLNNPLLELYIVTIRYKILLVFTPPLSIICLPHLIMCLCIHQNHTKRWRYFLKHSIEPLHMSF